MKNEKVTFRFAEKEKAKEFFSLMEEFSSHAMWPVMSFTEKDVTITPGDRVGDVTKIANDLGGYKPTKPENF